MQRPGLAISAATATTSIIILITVLATALKQIRWNTLLTAIPPAGWSTWMTIILAAALCGFTIMAVVVGLGWSEERS